MLKEYGSAIATGIASEPEKGLRTVIPAIDLGATLVELNDLRKNDQLGARDALIVTIYLVVIGGVIADKGCGTSDDAGRIAHSADEASPSGGSSPNGANSGGSPPSTPSVPETPPVALPSLPAKVLNQIQKAGLPTSGSKPFRTKLVKNKAGESIIDKAAIKSGSKKGKMGFVDEDGNIWIKDRAHLARASPATQASGGCQQCQPTGLRFA